jgi:tetratricopeptide (TPR) repeat protein
MALAPLSDVVVTRLVREMEGYLELGLHEDVIERANRLLAAEKARPRALELKARALQDSGRFDEAIELYEALRALEPASEAAYLGLGWCRKRTGRLDLAIAALEELLLREPEDPLGLYNLACYLALDGQRERPLALLRRAMALEDGFREHARTETDLDSLREDPEFRSLLDPG